MFACFSPFSSEAREGEGGGGRREGGRGRGKLIQATLHIHSIRTGHHMASHDIT